MSRCFVVLLALTLATPALAAEEASTVGDLLDALEQEVPAVARGPEVKADFDRFVASFDLEPTDALYADFVRVRIAFEATRAGGLWGLHWTVTHREPQSDAIWTAWSGLGRPSPARATAKAECDELSALFAFVARGLGVDGVGLFWPEWNHTVAVWKLKARDGSPVRVVVPTSQVWLEPTETLGTRGFDPWKQRTIYTYTRADVDRSTALDPALTAWFVAQVRTYGATSSATLQTLRNLRELRHSGLADRADVVRWLEAHRAGERLSGVDRAAVEAFVAEI